PPRASRPPPGAARARAVEYGRGGGRPARGSPRRGGPAETRPVHSSAPTIVPRTLVLGDADTMSARPPRWCCPRWAVLWRRQDVTEPGGRAATAQRYHAGMADLETLLADLRRLVEVESPSHEV